MGYATICWPNKDFDQALKSTSELGYNGIQMLGWVRDTYSDARESELKRQLSALKLRAAALPCSKVRLDPNNPTDESAEIEFLREVPKGPRRALSPGDRPREAREGVCQRRNQEPCRSHERARQDRTKLRTRAGYHCHFDTLGETREGLGPILEATDPKSVKLIADVAHLTLGGADPAQVIRTYHQRLIFCHFKDVRKDVAELAQQSRDLVRKSRYHFTEIGTAP